MEYAQESVSKALGAQRAGAAAASALCARPDPSRTLEGLSPALARAVGLRVRLEEMQDRVCPIPRSLLKEEGAKPNMPPSYAATLQGLQNELASISDIIDSLEGHI